MTKINESLRKRRTYYNINGESPVSEEKVVETIKELTELVPDAFNMKSQRVVVALGDKHKELWDGVYDAFDGQVSREKLDSFKVGVGTVLFFYDNKTVQTMREKYSLYEAQFEKWALQSNGMLQISVWSALEELGFGASLQHYNPVIDEMVRKMFDVDEDYIMLGQIVFGGIEADADPKDGEDIGKRFKLVK